MPGSKRDWVERSSPTSGSGRKLQVVEPHVAVDHIDQAARVERDVVALWRRPARRRLRNEMSNLVRAFRIGDIDDAQPAAEPDGVDDGARHALAELVRAEARAAG